MWLLIQRIINKVQLTYRIKVFRNYTGNYNNKINIYGPMTLINKNIKCGNNVSFYPNVMLFGDGPIIIGDNVCIGNNTILYSSARGGGITIGSNTMIAAHCYIIDTDHGVKKNPIIRNQENTSSPITIGNDVWIAASCTILKGSIINNGAIIGAMSLVKGRIEEGAIAFGIPARVRKYRE